MQRFIHALIGAALLAASCGSAAVSFDCPVTTPNGFVPPDTITSPRLDEFTWHGSERLFTPFNADGSYFLRKTVFWSSDFPGGGVEERPAVDITWRRIDIDADPITNDGDATNASTAEDGWFMIAGIDPDEPGCWQVDAEYKGAELSYVYEIEGA